MQRNNPYRVPKEITIKDLEKMDQSMAVDPNDIKKQGLRCLTLSNNFRRTQGKPELQWNDDIYKIGKWTMLQIDVTAIFFYSWQCKNRIAFLYTSRLIEFCLLLK